MNKGQKQKLSPFQKTEALLDKDSERFFNAQFPKMVAKLNDEMRLLESILHPKGKSKTIKVITNEGKPIYTGGV